MVNKGVKPLINITSGSVNIGAQIYRAGMAPFLTISDNIGFINDSFNLVVQNQLPGKNFTLPERGAEFEFSLGYSDKKIVPFGKYKVTDYQLRINAQLGQVLQIQGLGINYTTKGLANARQKTWVDGTSLLQVVFSLANSAGLGYYVDFELQGINVGHQIQNESDQAFLSKLAQRYDAIFKVKNNIVYFKKRESFLNSVSNVANQQVLKFNAKSDSDIVDISYNVSELVNYSGVKANYKSGDDVAEVLVGSEGNNVLVLPLTYDNGSIASNEARTKFRNLSRSNEKLILTTLGNPNLQSGQRIKVQGYRREIVNQSWYVMRADHIIDNSGYFTRLECDATIKE